MSNIAVDMKKITKAFPGVVALDNVDFNAMRGEVHGLVGENGAGKSTLIKILCGAYIKDKGDIYIGDQKVDITSPSNARQLGISVIHQELNLVPYFDAVSNIWVGREDEFNGILIQRKKMLSATNKILNRLGVSIPIDVPVMRLSVAQQQIVAIARALSEKATIMVMDEPTARLAAHEIEQLLQLVDQLKLQGITIIYISHRLEEVFRIADRITILKEGHQEGTVSTQDASIEEVIYMMVGQNIKERYYKVSTDLGRILLSVEGISDGNLLKDVSLQLRAGEILGIVGAVGSGRTELVRTIFGANPIKKGSITLNNKPLLAKRPADSIDRGIALVPEDRRNQGLILHMEVGENISLPALRRWSKWGFLQSSRERRATKKLAEEVDIRMVSIRQRVRYLSGGNQQKVVLAKWLGNESIIFLLDEPTIGIDIGAKVEIYRLISKLVLEGAGVIFVSSEIPEVLGIADRILAMHEGKVVASFDRSEATEQIILSTILAGELNSRTD